VVDSLAIEKTAIEELSFGWAYLATDRNPIAILSPPATEN